MKYREMATSKHILIVEDERDLSDLLAYNLQKAGYETDVAADGAAAIRQVRAAPPDLIVLDVMLPKLSGLEVAREIRRDPRTAQIPLLMVTARATEADQLAGLQLGADDYITKPFSMKLLLARVEALLRRSSAPAAEEGSQISFGPIQVDLDTHAAKVDGKPIQTTLTEFRILVALVRARGKTLSRLDLMARVMGPGVMVTARTIDVHIAAIRRKLGPVAGWVRTVRGVGYRLADDSDEPAEAEAAADDAARA